MRTASDCVRFLDEVRLVGGEAGLVTEIVERDDRALERDLAQVLRADLVESGVRGRDRVFHRGFDCLGRLLPIRDSQDGVRFRRRFAKGIDVLQFVRAGRHREAAKNQ